MPRRKSLILLVFFMQKVLDFITPMHYIIDCNKEQTA